MEVNPWTWNQMLANIEIDIWIDITACYLYFQNMSIEQERGASNTQNEYIVTYLVKLCFSEKILTIVLDMPFFLSNVIFYK